MSSTLRWQAMRTQIVSRKRNAIYSGLILFNHFSFGVNMNIMAAALIDLRHIYAVSIDTISLSTIALGFGYLCGALAGFLYRYFNRQVMLSIFVAMISLTVAFIPHYHASFYFLAAPMLLLNGIGCGAWDSGSSFWMVEMWPVGNDVMLQLIQFFYGLGSIAAPLVMAPFVLGEAVNRTDSDGVVRQITRQDRIDNLTVPYASVGAVLLIAPIIMLIMYFIAPYEKPSQSWKSAQICPSAPPLPSPINKEDNKIGYLENNFVNANNNNNNNNNSKHGRRVENGMASIVSPPTSARSAPLEDIPYRALKLAMCGICLSTYATTEINWFGFSSTMFQHLEYALDAATANHVQSVMAACFTVARFLTACLILFTRLIPDHIITYHYAIAAIGFGTLIVGRRDETWLYAGSAILGVGFSAQWPAILAFAQRHLQLSDRVCSLYSFLTGLMTMTIPVALHFTFDEHPMTLFVLAAIFMLISAAMFVAVRTLIWINARSKT